ncbi:MAG: DUF4923 family protein [Bacteroidales bacterium]|nr:DUF4923 family protein [Bacteroidales bacterium]MBN2819984.1 DUF4923 family protein [Bacteroidales bacterium]
MKKFLEGSKLFLVFGLIVSLSIACEKNNNESNLVGKWSITSSEMDISVGDLSLVDYIAESMDTTEAVAAAYAELFSQLLKSQMSGTFEFKSDGTYTANYGGGTDSGTWELNNDGNVITTDKGTDDETEMEVVKLTKDELIVRFTTSQEMDVNEDGNPDSMSMYFELTMGKV